MLNAAMVTGRNEVVAKVMFLLVFYNSVHRGGLWQGDPPARRPPWQGDPPGRETPLARRPPWQGDPPAGRPPARRPPRHTVNERPVRILLECILVYKLISTFSITRRFI